MIELPDRGFIAIQLFLDSDESLTDELIENNPALRMMLATSIARPREPPGLPNP